VTVKSGECDTTNVPVWNVVTNGKRLITSWKKSNPAYHCGLSITGNTCKKVEERTAKDQLIKLTAPTSSKQTVATKLHQYTIDFTYYKEGKDLIVESTSSDPLFGGIVQTYIDQGGKRLFAEMNPTPPRGNGTNRKIERYTNISNGDLMLNPFLYLWSDPSQTI
jgi:hypothetical protein